MSIILIPMNTIMIWGYVLLTYSLARFLIANYTKKGPGRVLDPGLKSIGKQVGRNWPIWKILDCKH